MNMDRVLVLGASGFIGKKLCVGLREQGVEVRAVARKFSSDWEDNTIEKCVGDFSDRHFIREALAGCSHIYHLISTTIPSTSVANPYDDCLSNVLPSIKLLDDAVEAGVKSIIFISSGGTVYGIPDSVPIKEDAATDPICPYGIHKLAIEKYMGYYARTFGLKTVVLRLSNPYGRLQKIDGLHGAIDVFVNKALCGEPIEVWGDGSVARDYIHISDVIRALMVVEKIDKAHAVVNIGSGKAVSLNQIVETIQKYMDVSVEYKPARIFDVPTICLDVNCAKELMDWEARISLEQGIAALISEREAA